jgi:hypothetical protein
VCSINGALHYLSYIQNSNDAGDISEEVRNIHGGEEELKDCWEKKMTVSL